MGATALVLGLAVAGTAAGAYGASQASKGSGQTRNLGSEVSGMPIGDYLDHIKSLGDTQFLWNQRTAGLDLSLYPQFQGKQTEGQLRAGKAELSLYPMFAAAERAETNRQRDADLSYLGKKGASYQNVLRSLSPAYAGLDQLAASVSAGGGTTPLLDYLNDEAMHAGPSPLRSKLAADALYELNLGDSLTPEQSRDALQTARASWADRGLAYSSPAVASEILSRDQAAQQRLAQRRALAQSVWNMGNTEDQTNHNFQLGVQGANEDALSRRFSILSGVSNAQLSPILSWAGSRTATNPLAAAGAMQLAPGIGVPASIMSTSPQVPGMAQAVSPLYGYGQDLYNTNFNAAEARAINSANAWAAMGGGMVKSSGDIYSAYLQSQGGGGGGGGKGGSGNPSV